VGLLPGPLRRHTRPVAGPTTGKPGLRASSSTGVQRRADRPHARRPRAIRCNRCSTRCPGDSLIFFPEGTRNLEDGLLPFKSGLYHLAKSYPQAELIPVWIANLNRVMPKGRVLPLPLLCTTSFGAPLQLQEGEDKRCSSPVPATPCCPRPGALPDMASQTLMLFGGIGAILVLASLIGLILKLRSRGAPNAVIDNLNARINAWWVMVVVIGIAFWLGTGAVIVLFYAVSFYALREFLTLTPTRRSDYPALVAAFYWPCRCNTC
jgi:hypothetical protein